MNIEEIKAQIEDRERKIKVLDWDRQRNQLQYSKESYLKKLREEVEELRKKLEASD